MLLGVCVEARRTARNGREVKRSVSVVEVQNDANGSQIVRGVVVAVAVYVVVQPVVPVLPAEKYFGAQIVHVAAARVDDVAENPLLHHVEHHELGSSVAAVLEEHERCASLLVGADEPEAVLKRVGAADLKTDRNTGFHEADRNVNVILPA